MRLLTILIIIGIIVSIVIFLMKGIATIRAIPMLRMWYEDGGCLGRIFAILGLFSIISGVIALIITIFFVLIMSS